MGKPKLELYYFYGDEDGAVHGHHWHLESSAIFKFLNFNFLPKETNDNILNDIYKTLRHDDLVSPRQYFHINELKHFTDYMNDSEGLILYFTVLQEELRTIFEYLVDFFVNNKGLKPLSFAYSSPGENHQGPFKFLGNYLYELGKLEYESNNGNLILFWDSEVSSFKQILIRSLIGFMQQGGLALKYVCKCHNSFEEKIKRKPSYVMNRSLECGKFYFNIDGNDKYCSTSCRKKFHDTARDQSDRHNSLSRYNYLQKKEKAATNANKPIKKQKNRLT